MDFYPYAKMLHEQDLHEARAKQRGAPFKKRLHIGELLSAFVVDMWRRQTIFTPWYMQGDIQEHHSELTFGNERGSVK